MSQELCSAIDTDTDRGAAGEKELLLVWILHEYAREMHPQKTFIEHESVLLSINPTRGIGNIRGASHGSAVIGGISATEHSIT